MELQDVVSRLVEDARDRRTRERRAAKRVSFTEIAKEIGVTQPTLFRICDGTTKSPKSDVVRKLTAYFKITVKELFGDTPVPDDWEMPDKAGMSQEEKAGYVADGIRSMLLAAGFNGDELGGRDALVRAITSREVRDLDHTMAGDLPQPTPNELTENQPRQPEDRAGFDRLGIGEKKETPGGKSGAGQ